MRLALRQYCPYCGKMRRAVPGIWGWKTVGWADRRTLERWIQGTERDREEATDGG